MSTPRPPQSSRSTPASSKPAPKRHQKEVSKEKGKVGTRKRSKKTSTGSPESSSSCLPTSPQDDAALTYLADNDELQRQQALEREVDEREQLYGQSLKPELALDLSSVLSSAILSFGPSRTPEGLNHAQSTTKPSPALPSTTSMNLSPENLPSVPNATSAPISLWDRTSPLPPPLFHGKRFAPPLPILSHRPILKPDIPSLPLPLYASNVPFDPAFAHLPRFALPPKGVVVSNCEQIDVYGPDYVNNPISKAEDVRESGAPTEMNAVHVQGDARDTIGSVTSRHYKEKGPRLPLDSGSDLDSVNIDGKDTSAQGSTSQSSTRILSSPSRIRSLPTSLGSDSTHSSSARSQGTGSPSKSHRSMDSGLRHELSKEDEAIKLLFVGKTEYQDLKLKRESEAIAAMTAMMAEARRKKIEQEKAKKAKMLALVKEKEQKKRKVGNQVMMTKGPSSHIGTMNPERPGRVEGVGRIADGMVAEPVSDPENKASTCHQTQANDNNINRQENAIGAMNEGTGSATMVASSSAVIEPTAYESSYPPPVVTFAGLSTSAASAWKSAKPIQDAVTAREERKRLALEQKMMEEERQRKEAAIANVVDLGRIALEVRKNVTAARRLIPRFMSNQLSDEQVASSKGIDLTPITAYELALSALDKECAAAAAKSILESEQAQPSKPHTTVTTPPASTRASGRLSSHLFPSANTTSSTASMTTPTASQSPDLHETQQDQPLTQPSSDNETFQTQQRQEVEAQPPEDVQIPKVIQDSPTLVIPPTPPKTDMVGKSLRGLKLPGISVADSRELLHMWSAERSVSSHADDSSKGFNASKNMNKEGMTEPSTDVEDMLKVRMKEEEYKEEELQHMKENAVWLDIDDEDMENGGGEGFLTDEEEELSPRTRGSITDLSSKRRVSSTVGEKPADGKESYFFSERMGSTVLQTGLHEDAPFFVFKHKDKRRLPFDITPCLLWDWLAVTSSQLHAFVLDSKGPTDSERISPAFISDVSPATSILSSNVGSDKGKSESASQRLTRTESHVSSSIRRLSMVLQQGLSFDSLRSSTCGNATRDLSGFDSSSSTSCLQDSVAELANTSSFFAGPSTKTRRPEQDVSPQAFVALANRIYSIIAQRFSSVFLPVLEYLVTTIIAKVRDAEEVKRREKVMAGNKGADIDDEDDEDDEEEDSDDYRDSEDRDGQPSEPESNTTEENRRTKEGDETHDNVVEQGKADEPQAEGEKEESGESEEREGDLTDRKHARKKRRSKPIKRVPDPFFAARVANLLSASATQFLLALGVKTKGPQQRNEGNLENQVHALFPIYSDAAVKEFILTRAEMISKVEQKRLTKEQELKEQEQAKEAEIISERKKERDRARTEWLRQMEEEEKDKGKRSETVCGNDQDDEEGGMFEGEPEDGSDNESGGSNDNREVVNGLQRDDGGPATPAMQLESAELWNTQPSSVVISADSPGVDVPPNEKRNSIAILLDKAKQLLECSTGMEEAEEVEAELQQLAEATNTEPSLEESLAKLKTERQEPRISLYPAKGDKAASMNPSPTIPGVIFSGIQDLDTLDEGSQRQIYSKWVQPTLVVEEENNDTRTNIDECDATINKGPHESNCGGIEASQLKASATTPASTATSTQSETSLPRSDLPSGPTPPQTLARLTSEALLEKCTRAAHTYMFATLVGRAYTGESLPQGAPDMLIVSATPLDSVPSSPRPSPGPPSSTTPPPPPSDPQTIPAPDAKFVLNALSSILQPYTSVLVVGEDDEYAMPESLLTEPIPLLIRALRHAITHVGALLPIPPDESLFTQCSRDAVELRRSISLAVASSCVGSYLRFDPQTNAFVPLTTSESYPIYTNQRPPTSSSIDSTAPLDQPHEGHEDSASPPPIVPDSNEGPQRRSALTATLSAPDLFSTVQNYASQSAQSDFADVDGPQGNEHQGKDENERRCVDASEGEGQGEDDVCDAVSPDILSSSSLISNVRNTHLRHESTPLPPLTGDLVIPPLGPPPPQQLPLSLPHRNSKQLSLSNSSPALSHIPAHSQATSSLSATPRTSTDVVPRLSLPRSDDQTSHHAIALLQAISSTSQRRNPFAPGQANLHGSASMISHNKRGRASLIGQANTARDGLKLRSSLSLPSSAAQAISAARSSLVLGRPSIPLSGKWQLDEALRGGEGKGSQSSVSLTDMLAHVAELAAASNVTIDSNRSSVSNLSDRNISTPTSPSISVSHSTPNFGRPSLHLDSQHLPYKDAQPTPSSYPSGSTMLLESSSGVVAEVNSETLAKLHQALCALSLPHLAANPDALRGLLGIAPTLMPSQRQKQEDEMFLQKHAEALRFGGGQLASEQESFRVLEEEEKEKTRLKLKMEVMTKHRENVSRRKDERALVRKRILESSIFKLGLGFGQDTESSSTTLPPSTLPPLGKSLLTIGDTDGNKGPNDELTPRSTSIASMNAVKRMALESGTPLAEVKTTKGRLDESPVREMDVSVWDQGETKGNADDDDDEDQGTGEYAWLTWLHIQEGIGIAGEESMGVTYSPTTSILYWSPTPPRFLRKRGQGLLEVGLDNDDKVQEERARCLAAGSQYLIDAEKRGGSAFRSVPPWSTEVKEAQFQIDWLMMRVQEITYELHTDTAGTRQGGTTARQSNHKPSTRDAIPLDTNALRMIRDCLREKYARLRHLFILLCACAAKGGAGSIAGAQGEAKGYVDLNFMEMTRILELCRVANIADERHLTMTVIERVVSDVIRLGLQSEEELQKRKEMRLKLKERQRKRLEMDSQNKAMKQGKDKKKGDIKSSTERGGKGDGADGTHKTRTETMDLAEGASEKGRKEEEKEEEEEVDEGEGGSLFGGMPAKGSVEYLKMKGKGNILRAGKELRIIGVEGIKSIREMKRDLGAPDKLLSRSEFLEVLVRLAILKFEATDPSEYDELEHKLRKHRAQNLLYKPKSQGKQGGTEGSDVAATTSKKKSSKANKAISGTSATGASTTKTGSTTRTLSSPAQRVIFMIENYVIPALGDSRMVQLDFRVYLATSKRAQSVITAHNRSLFTLFKRLCITTESVRQRRNPFVPKFYLVPTVEYGPRFEHLRLRFTTLTSSGLTESGSSSDLTSSTITTDTRNTENTEGEENSGGSSSGGGGLSGGQESPRRTTRGSQKRSGSSKQQALISMGGGTLNDLTAADWTALDMELASDASSKGVSPEIIVEICQKAGMIGPLLSLRNIQVAIALSRDENSDQYLLSYPSFLETLARIACSIVAATSQAHHGSNATSAAFLEGNTQTASPSEPSKQNTVSTLIQGGDAPKVKPTTTEITNGGNGGASGTINTNTPVLASGLGVPTTSEEASHLTSYSSLVWRNRVGQRRLANVLRRLFSVLGAPEDSSSGLLPHQP